MPWKMPGLGIFDPLIGLMSPVGSFYLVLAIGLALNISLIIILKGLWLKLTHRLTDFFIANAITQTDVHMHSRTMNAFSINDYCSHFKSKLNSLNSSINISLSDKKPGSVFSLAQVFI